MLEQYPLDVKLVFKNFPLSSHKFARSAAQAALAAHEQGKFWQYHDKLFEEFNKIDNNKLEEVAKLLSLDMERFNRDRSSSKIVKQVNDDQQDGARSNVRGTPTIFVNGRLLKNRSMEGFQAAIEQALAKARAKEQ